MSETNIQHNPVLFDAVLDALAIEPDGIYIDGTFGRGGHAQGILKRLGPKGRLYAFDKDSTAIRYGQEHIMDDRLILQQGSFAMMECLAQRYQLQGCVNGILLDLGVSSPQLDVAERGFSFLREGPLDMRMDSTSGMSAADWVNKAKEEEISHVLFTFGEERFSRRIARAIVAARTETPITTTRQLAEIIAKAHPAWERGKHPATQSFQAIRIHINQELEDLQATLPMAVKLLAAGGRLAVISFHSLEDRIVKRFLRTESKGESLPRDLPIAPHQIKRSLKLIGKAQHASQEEVAQNPRARSAVLRIAEKLSW